MNLGDYQMKTILCIGKAGTGKTSYINDAMGTRLPENPFYHETDKVMAVFRKDICYIDTPGMAHPNPESDVEYAKEINRCVNLLKPITNLSEVYFFFSANDTRIKNEDYTVINTLTEHIGYWIWGNTFFVITKCDLIGGEILKMREKKFLSAVTDHIAKQTNNSSFAFNMIIRYGKGSWSNNAVHPREILNLH